MMLRALYALLVVPVVLAGCASIIKGGHQKISVASEPAGARVVITDLRENRDVVSGSTPLTTELKRGAGWFKKGTYRLVVEQPGYRKEETTIEGTPNGWYIGGNLLFGGLIGYLIVDPLTGGMWTLEPSDLKLTLKKDAAGAPEPSLTVVQLDQVPPMLLTKMRPVYHQAP